MAKQESDREDLMREATALVERIELSVADFNEAVIIGFRRDGSGSVFFGPERVYQFNKANELRRGYLAGKLIKAESGRLASLTRETGKNEINLRRHDFSSAETEIYIRQMQEHLNQLHEKLRAGEFKVTASIPDWEEILPRLLDWLQTLLAAPAQIAKSPRVGG